ncbi:MAG: hypothetical protein LBG70_05045, partial [Bifidobacteriaceae bacterium]|nr:hypothetical protein [Bifidobacteriaceae bacterium]
MTFADIKADTTLYAHWIDNSPTNPNVQSITTRDGSNQMVLGYSNYSGIKLITADGTQVNPASYQPDGTNPVFKDLNKNGVLDAYEDWRKTTEQRATNLADLMKDDPDGIAQIAGLMLYSGHQTSWSSSNPSQDQVTFLVNDDLRHVLIAGSAQGGQMGIHADWNNN